MKFLCLECDEVMVFAERQLPGDGTLAAVYICGTCDREIAMLTNPMETQLVSSLGVHIGGRGVPEQPMEMVRSSLADPREDVFEEPAERALGIGGDIPLSPAQNASESEPGTVGRPAWSPEALARLENVPRFVRGMVKRIYTDYARENGITEMTPDIMDRARSDLGLEGM